MITKAPVRRGVSLAGAQHNSGEAVYKLLGSQNWSYYWSTPTIDDMALWKQYGVDLVPMVRMGNVSDNCQPPASYQLEMMQALAKQYPGMYWLVGNEPNFARCMSNSLDTYIQIEDLLLSSDASAKIIFGNVATGDFRWVGQFKDAFLSKTGRLPNWQGIGAHFYAADVIWIKWLQTARYARHSNGRWLWSARGMENRILDFDGWCRNQNYKEWWITEIGNLRPYSSGCQVDKFIPSLLPVFAKTERLTRACWFSFRPSIDLKNLPEDDGALFYADNTPTPLGLQWAKGI